MKVTNEKTENSQAYLTIEMEPEEVEKSLESSYKRLVKNARVPGFRKGKAPRDIFERYVGKESLLEDALNILVPQACEDAIKEQEIEAIAQPQIELTQMEPVTFTAVVPLKPTVNLGDYQTIKMKPEKIDVTDETVDRIVENLQHQYATWEPVEEGAVEYDNMVGFDIESTVEDKPFINQKGAQYQVKEDQAFPAPGFAEELLGMKAGEEKEFTLTVPEDSTDTEVAGKEVSFKVRLNEIKREVLPELTDEFAAQVDPELKTMKELREKALADMTKRAEENARLEFEEKVLDALVEMSEVEFPPVLEEMEVHRLMEQNFQGGTEQMGAYLQSVGKTEEELHEELHPVAAKRVRRSLALGKIIEEENITVGSADIDKEIEDMVKDAGENRESLLNVFNNPQARETIEQRLVSRKAMEYLTGIATAPKTKKKTKKEEE